MEVRYIKKISEGAFGRVDLVEDENGTRLARKTLLPQRRRDYVHQRIMTRFQNEVRFMKNARHNALTPIYFAELDTREPWYVMPLAISSLRSDLENKSRDNPLILQALFDILSGLDYMHKSGFYHRDICCANALRFETENGYCYKLSDFGTVTRHGGTGPFYKIDSGHYRYAPPEITVKPMLGSQRSDIYGFGAILHEIYGEEPRVAKACIDGERGPLAEIMKKCTAENPDHRYGNIAAVYNDLSTVLLPQSNMSGQETGYPNARATSNG